jgi:hypothetical protein
VGDRGAGRRAEVAGRNNLTLRGLLVGLGLMFLNAHLVFQADMVWGVFLVFASPFSNVIFLLFLVTLTNLLLARRVPRLALTTADLIAVYVMLSLQTCIGAGMFLYRLMNAISYGHWGATPTNRWGSLYLPQMPEWLLVTDPDALKGYYLGQSTFFSARAIRAWLAPILYWTLLFYGLLLVLIATAVLFSGQWIRRERLSFPIVELPFQMVAIPAFWQRPAMWVGFGLAAGAELLNGLGYLYPSVPQLPIRRTNIGPLFTTPPWNAMGETNLSVYPFIIGLSFLMPLDLSVSLWVFYLFHKAQRVFGAVVGWNEIPQYPFPRDQQFGAGAAIILAALWASREHLRRVWRVAFGRRKAEGGRR